VHQPIGELCFVMDTVDLFDSKRDVRPGLPFTGSSERSLNVDVISSS